MVTPSPDPAPHDAASPGTATPADAPDPARLAQRLTLGASQFSRMAARLAEVGVSSVSWRVASTLEHHGPLRLSEIAARERVTRPTATDVVRRLEQEGLVARTPDPRDSRSALVDLTAAGRAQLGAWRAQLATGVGPVLADLPAADLAILDRAAGILAELVETHDG